MTEEAKKADLKDFLNSINLNKDNLVRGNPENAKAYPAFVCLRSLSYFQQLIPIVSVLNESPGLDSLQHFEFLLYSVPKAKRFAKWAKPELAEDRELVAKVYNCSKDKADTFLKLLTEEQLQSIRDHFKEGGAEKMKKGK